MSFPEDMPQNARFWPKSRIDELRAMASKDAPTDPAERERQHQWFREFARDAPAWMDVESEQADIVSHLIELRAFAQGMLAKTNEMLAAMRNLPAYENKSVETPEYTELNKEVRREEHGGRVQWNWLEDLPGPKSAMVDSNHKIKAGLAKLRQREAAEPELFAEHSAPAASAREPRSTQKMDATMARLAEEYGLDVAAYVRASFGNRRISPRDVGRKMERFVGVFKSPQSACTALAARLGVEPPANNLVSWMKARAEVFNREQQNHYAVWLGAHGLGRRKKKAA